MSNTPSAARRAGPSHRSMEIAVAIFTALFGAIVVAGSLQVGINWGVEGPRAGFFPFYIGLTIIVSSGVNIYRAVTEGEPGKLFADWGQLRQVMSVVLPTAVYVAVIPALGLYLSSALLIALFMKWLGRYRWGLTLALALGVPVLFYLLFEKWFLVPLPKGPLEEWLGL